MSLHPNLIPISYYPSVNHQPNYAKKLKAGRKIALSAPLPKSCDPKLAPRSQILNPRRHLCRSNAIALYWSSVVTVFVGA